MQYLLEHDFGFDVDGIGFPSISGCHAIAYLTSNGLFGFHNAGGSGKGDFAPRAMAFATYVREHFDGNGNGLHLYGCSFVGDNRRGYTIGQAMAQWKEELQAMATALNFGGTISGYDLHGSGINQPGSAYVEYRVNGNACDIFVKQWTDAGKALGANEKRNNHKRRVGAVPDTIVTAVDATGMGQVIPQVLR
jgi:hypothetical protein